jgi:dihydrodiol dehydrogenase / D-xylose 1-dehydrogenase (NADP)
MDAIRWGILGTGGIAQKFAEGLALLPEARMTAVGSRTQASGDAFGEKWKIPNRHASYAALMADPEVDAVYIATPHTLHHENAIGCLSAGKAVLCEKPFTINVRQAEDVIALARKQRVFLMEAMWTRFLPIFVKIRSLLAEDAIGTVRQVQADFGFRPAFDPKSRLFDPAGCTRFRWRRWCSERLPGGWHRGPRSARREWTNKPARCWNIRTAGWR